MIYVTVHRRSIDELSRREYAGRYEWTMAGGRDWSPTVQAEGADLKEA
jgi:hypothetical protein